MGLVGLPRWDKSQDNQGINGMEVDSLKHKTFVGTPCIGFGQQSSALLIVSYALLSDGI